MSSHFSLVGAASYLPENIIDNDFFIESSNQKKHPMFRGTKFRRHIGKHESAADMAVHAINKLSEQLNLNPQKDIDILLTNVSLPDIPFTGIGAVVSKNLNAKPMHIFDISNGGCVSFVFMMELAKALLQTTAAKTAMICNVQTSAGRIFAQTGNREYPQSAIPGDGCGVAYFTASDESPVLSVVTKQYNEYAEDMKIKTDDERYWWQPGNTPFNVDFSNSKLAAIIRRGNRIVPEVLYAACEEADIDTDDVDYLITNQPNRVFLRNWRESIDLPEEQHIDTFDDHGNLFGAAIPICLAKGFEEGTIKNNSKILVGGFSHAGDYAGAAIIDWKGK